MNTHTETNFGDSVGDPQIPLSTLWDPSQTYVPNVTEPPTRMQKVLMFGRILSGPFLDELRLYRELRGLPGMVIEDALRYDPDSELERIDAFTEMMRQAVAQGLDDLVDGASTPARRKIVVGTHGYLGDFNAADGRLLDPLREHDIPGVALTFDCMDTLEHIIPVLCERLERIANDTPDNVTIERLTFSMGGMMDLITLLELVEHERWSVLQKLGWTWLSPPVSGTVLAEVSEGYAVKHFSPDGAYVRHVQERARRIPRWIGERIAIYHSTNDYVVNSTGLPIEGLTELTYREAGANFNGGHLVIPDMAEVQRLVLHRMQTGQTKLPMEQPVTRDYMGEIRQLIQTAYARRSRQPALAASNLPHEAVPALALEEKAA